MRNTQKFLELARQGDFDLAKLRSFDGVECIEPEEILLRPTAWQAVGRVKEWKEIDGVYIHEQESWRQIWKRFIDLLADGKSIEDALGEILSK